jgi:hypothetical protein
MSQMTNKIAALIKKGNDKAASEAEAEAALSMAQQLMDRHGLTLEDVTGDDGEAVEIFEGVEVKGRWKKCLPYLIGPLTEFCNVRSYRRRYGSNYKQMWVGYRSDVDLATWLYSVIQRSVMTESRKYDPPTQWVSEAARMRDDFAIGMAARIGERLKKIIADRAAATPPSISGTDIVAVRNAALDEALEELGLKRARKSRDRALDSRAISAGVDAGNNVGLGRPVEKSTGPLALQQ